MSLEEPMCLRVAFEGVRVELPGEAGDLWRLLRMKQAGLRIIQDQILFYAKEISGYEILIAEQRATGNPAYGLVNLVLRNREKLSDFVRLSIARKAEVERLERMISAGRMEAMEAS